MENNQTKVQNTEAEQTKTELDKVTEDVLKVIDSYGFKQEGAYNLRLNGMAVCHGDSRHIHIVKKEDKPGIDIHISGEAKDEQVHIPVVMSQEGIDVVYNDFYIEDGADVTIIAGCGIHGEGRLRDPPRRYPCVPCGKRMQCKICGESLCRGKRNRTEGSQPCD